MADDDDWETDADFENNLTEAEQRAYGNAETKARYEQVMEKSGATAPGESLKGVTMAPATAPPTPPPSLPVVATAAAGDFTAPPSAYEPVKAPTPTKLDLKSVFNTSMKNMSPKPLEGVASTPSGSASKNVLNRTRRISDQQAKELADVFKSFDTDGSETLTVDELEQAFNKLGMPTPKDKLTAMLKAADTDGNGKIDFNEFVSMAERIKAQKGTKDAISAGFTEMVDKGKAKIQQVSKTAGTHTAVHSFAEDECVAFVEFLNSKLGWDPKLKYLLPVSDYSELFAVCSDGVILCKLINVAVAETIDERVINLQPNNRFLINENLNLAIQAAKSIGMKVVNIGASDIADKQPHLVLGLVWQIVKSCLLSKINLKENPNLIRLLEEGETLEMLLKLPPEKLLMRWFNHHLKEAGCEKRVNNFGADLKDSELYSYLMQQIDPEKQCNTRILQNPDLTHRATYIASSGVRLGAEFSVQAADITSGNEKLNLAFVAALFNACPALDPPPPEEVAELLAELPPEDDTGDSREERAFRMWINSLGMEGVHCDNLFDDVRDGLVLLHTMDHIRPGAVQWGRVNKKEKCKMVFKRNENCSYVIDLGKDPFAFSLVGVGGKDIVDGNKKLTLGLIWQMMRTDMMAFMAKVRSGTGQAMTDKAIVKWANDKVGSAAPPINDFHDRSLADGLFLIELLAAIEVRCIDRTLVTPGKTDDEKKLNAKYVLSSARKIGCSLFLLWEDIVEVKPKMILSFVAAVMSHDMQNTPLTTPRGTVRE